MREFSALHNIHPATLGKWKSRLKHKNTSLAKPSGFARINVFDPSCSSSKLFAEVKGIKIYQPVSASFLKELLA